MEKQFRKMMADVSKRKTARGFTLVEVMIAMTIFTVLITIGMGSVLTAISQHQTIQNSRTIMDNMNFIMEDMARNIRLGENFRCVTDPSEVEPVIVSGGSGPTAPIAPQSCLLGVPSSATSNKIIFNDLNGNHITYTVTVPVSGSTDSEIYKQSTDSSAPEQITPPEVTIDFSKSGFTVRGAEADDGAQPSVTIRLAGDITYKGLVTAFAIQTTVTPRALDS